MFEAGVDSLSFRSRKTVNSASFCWSWTLGPGHKAQEGG